MPQQPLLAPQTAAVAGELGTPAAADDAVAGHDDGDRVAAVGRAHRAHGLGIVDSVGDGLNLENYTLDSAQIEFCIAQTIG